MLEEKVAQSEDARPPLIAGFIHEGSVILVSAEPGVGKSTIAACWMAQASSGLPVFGQLFVPRPLVIYYIPFERGAEEIAERFRYIQNSVKINWDNLYVNPNFAGFNVNKDSHADEIIGTIRHDLAGRHADIIVLDPIYAAVPGGLSKDEAATQFTRFSSRLQAEFGCANYLNHHTSRDKYTDTGDKVERDDPFYGSQWLKAHCTGGFLLKRISENPVLLNKKDNHSCLMKSIPLQYDPADYTVYMAESTDGGTSMTHHDRLLMLYRTLYTQGKESITFAQIQRCLMGVSHSHLRRLMRHPPFSTAFSVAKSNGKASLYTPTIPL